MLVAAAAVLMPASAPAATIAVDTTDDQFDTDSAHCSLREAIYSADSSTHIATSTPPAPIAPCTAGDKFVDADVIELPPGTYTLTIGGRDENDAETGDLDIWEGLAIEGMPGGPVVIDGGGVDRVFQLLSDPLVTLRNLTVTGGDASAPASIDETGGAVALTGIGNLAVERSTLSGNQADGSGGGIAAGATLSLSNSTVSGNTSTNALGAGAIDAGLATTLSLDHVTLTANAGGATGGVSTPSTGATLHDSILAGNSGPNPDCSGTLGSAGGNVVGSTTGCTFNSVSSDALNVSALLGPLANNGGTTFTHALLSGSPAIDRGVATCAPTDQRGVARPQGPACDSGAFERVPPPASSPPTTTATTTIPDLTPVVDPCPPLRKKLRKAKRKLRAARRAGDPTAKPRRKVRKLKRKLKRLGC